MLDHERCRRRRLRRGLGIFDCKVLDDLLPMLPEDVFYYLTGPGFEAQCQVKFDEVLGMIMSLSFSKAWSLQLEALFPCTAKVYWP